MSKNFDFNKRFKNDIEDNNENIYGRLNDADSQKIDFTAFKLHADYPPAWKLIKSERSKNDYRSLITLKFAKLFFCIIGVKARC